MNKLVLQGIALLLILLALPLASLGTLGDVMWLIVGSLILTAIGGLTPPVLKFVGNDDDDKESQ